MKTLYLDCSMGAAGDMLTAALLELLPEPEEFIRELNALGIPGIVFQKKASVKCGITGTHIKVTVHGVEEGDHNHDHSHGHECHGHTHSHENHDHIRNHEHTHSHENHDHSHGHERHGHTHSHSHHHHSSLRDIQHLVCDHLSLSQKVKKDIMAVYTLIAEAESKAHGVPVSEIHFHEVGTMDAVADITAVCMLMERLLVDEVVVSPIHVGSGQVKCAHGILPVPAPATADILKNVPIYAGTVVGELCTPTGAALLKHFATRFGSMPVMKIRSIGYGMGKKDFEEANCVRAMLGDTNSSENDVWELTCNIDDMTGESMGFAMERLWEAGALDVYTMSIGMKKCRPGTLLHVMCKEKDKEILIETIFKYTTTIGIREYQLHRYVLDRYVETKETDYGRVRCKISSGYGVKRRKYEYEDLSRIAKERNLSIEEVLSKIKRLEDTESKQ